MTEQKREKEKKHQYYQSHRAERLAYSKQYNMKHRKEIKIRMKEHFKKNRTLINAQNLRRFFRTKELLLNEIGKKCLICGRIPKRLIFHEIYFLKHPIKQSYIITHKEDFVTLCPYCHNSLHRFRKYQTKMEKLLYGERTV